MLQPIFYLGIGVFEIRRYGVGSQVAPFAYDGIAQEAVVCFVGVTGHDDVVELAAYFAVGA